MNATVFVTGSNRGIGLELVKQYAEDDFTVYATCRDPQNAQDLNALAAQFSKIHILKLELKSEQSIQALSTQLKGVPIDILINNAGIIGDRMLNLEALNQNSLLEAFTVNAVAPLLVTKVLMPNLRLGTLKCVAALSSNLGSIASTTQGSEWNLYPYKSSKAALNMLMTCLKMESAYADLRVLILHPGWVRTDMGGMNAEIDPKVSVLGLRKVLMDKKISTGSYVDWKGNLLPW